MNWYKIIKISNIQNILRSINIKQENINDITSFLNNISDTRVKGKYIAAIKEGIKSNPNFNVNDLRNINIKQNYIPSSKAQELLNRYKNEKIYNWLRKELSKNNEVNLKVIEDNINHIIDWIKDENLDINNYKLEDAIKLSNEWTSKTFKGSSDKYSSNIIDMQFKDGFTMKKVTPEDAKVEGKKMNHCVGSYEKNIKNNKVEVYSLRDKNNEPHVTIAIIYGETVTELKGNSNSNPNAKYGKYIKEWLNKHPEIKYYKNEKNAKEYGLKDADIVFSDIEKWKEGDEKYILRGIRYSSFYLRYVKKDMLDNIEFMKKAIDVSAISIAYASKRIKDNYEVALLAAKRNGESYPFISDRLKSNKNIALEAVKSSPIALSYAPDDIKGDRDVVLESVKNYGTSLRLSQLELRDDKEIVLSAVRQNGNSLGYASPRLREDRDVVIEAVKNNGNALFFASKELKSDREIVLEAVRQNGESIKFTYPSLRDDKEIALAAISNSGNLEALFAISDRLRDDREIIIKAMEKDPYAFRYASDRLRDDEDIALLAIKQLWLNFYCVSKRLREDPDFLKKIETFR